MSQTRTNYTLKFPPVNWIVEESRQESRIYSPKPFILSEWMDFAFFLKDFSFLYFFLLFCYSFSPQLSLNFPYFSSLSLLFLYFLIFKKIIYINKRKNTLDSI